MTHSLGSPTRDMPVLTPTMVLSLRVPLCGRQKDRWLVCRLTTTSTSSSPARLAPWLNRGLCPASDHHIRTRASININSDPYHDHGEIILGGRGLNVNIALGRPRYFFGQRMRILRHRLLEYRFNDRFSGIVRNRVYNNPGKFRRAPMEESLTIYDITGALSNLDGNLDEFRARSPAPSSDVL